MRSRDSTRLARLRMHKVPRLHPRIYIYILARMSILFFINVFLTGIVVALMEKVVQNEFRNGFAIVRPPGRYIYIYIIR
jgi:hypothetical protein